MENQGLTRRSFIVGLAAVPAFTTGIGLAGKTPINQSLPPDYAARLMKARGQGKRPPKYQIDRAKSIFVAGAQAFLWQS